MRVDRLFLLQALPYCVTLFFIPAHFLTFEMLLFLTGIWTTNIHDCVDGKVTARPPRRGVHE